VVRAWSGQAVFEKTTRTVSWAGWSGWSGQNPTYCARARRSYCQETRCFLRHSQTNFVGKWPDRLDQKVKSISYMGPWADQFWTKWDKEAKS